jgi:hypothetical protein
LYTGEAIKKMLIIDGVKCDDILDSKLEEIGEEVNLCMCTELDKDMLQDKNTQQRIFLMMVKHTLGV